MRALPAFRGQATDERRGVGAHGLHRRERRLHRMRVVVELDRPPVLIVVVEGEVVLAGEIANAGRGIRLRISAVADDLVYRPFARTRPPPPGGRGHRAQRLPERGHTVFILSDQLGSFVVAHWPTSSGAVL